MVNLNIYLNYGNRRLVSMSILQSANNNLTVVVRELVNGQSYDLWYKSIKNAFRASGIMYLIDGEESNAETNVKATAQGIGLMIITNSLSDVGQRYILECETVKEALAKLEPLYSKEDTLISLNKEFNNLQWRSQSAEIYINDLNSVKLRMEALDIDLKLDRFTAKLLNEIPDCIEYVKKSYEIDDILGKQIDYIQLQKVIIKAYRREQTNSNEKKKQEQQSNLNSSFFHQTNNKLRRPFRRRPFNQSEDGDNPKQSNDNTYAPFHKKCGQSHPMYKCPMYKQNTCNCGRKHPIEQCPNNRSHLFNSNAQSTERDSGSLSQNSNEPQSSNPHGDNRGHNSNRSNRNRPSNANVPGRVPNQQSRQPVQFCNLLLTNGLDSNKLYLDNCGTDHSTGDLSKLRNYIPFNTPSPMISSNGGVALGKGELHVISYIDQVVQPVILKDVLYLPKSPITIVSQLKFEDKGCNPVCSSDGTFNYTMLYLNDEPMLLAKRKINSADWRLYVTTMEFEPLYNFMTMSKAHGLLAHAHDQKIINTSKCVNGLRIERAESLSANCETCIVSKSRNRTFNHTLCKEHTPGFVLHTDINELSTTSIGGSKYAIVFVCEASRFKRTYYAKDLTADELLKKIQNCFNDQFYDLGYFPKRLHGDQGRNYLSNIVQDYLATNRVKWTDSTAYNHQQNGLAEKTHLDLTNMTNSLINSNQMPKRVWSVAMNYATRVSNLLHHSSINQTPFECYYGYKPDLSHLREFGCKVLVHIPKHKRSNKLSPKAKEMIFVGHTDTTVNYLVMDMKHSSVTDTTAVHFIDESAKSNRSKSIKINTLLLPHEADSSSEDKDSGSNSSEEEDDEPLVETNGNTMQVYNSTADEQGELEQHSLDQSLINFEDAKDDTIVAPVANQIRSTINEQNEPNSSTSPIERIYEFNIKVNDVQIPGNVQEMLNSPYKDFWIAASDVEYLNWLEYEAYTLVPSTGKEKITPAHFIYSIKSSDGERVSKFKARYVLDGSRIKEKPEYSPVAHTDSMRTLFAYATKNKLHVHTLDFTSAYLNSPMTAEYHMKQMPLYEISNLSNYICKLNRWSYGLPASGYEWYRTLMNELKDLGFNQSKLDDCIFFNLQYFLIILIYVDDLMLVSNEIDTIVKFKEQIKSKFKFRDGGPIERFLGIDFTYQLEQQMLYFSLKSKILKLHANNIKNVPKPTKVPLDKNTKFDVESLPTEFISRYRSNIGSLNFISRVRPDIVTVVSRLARYMQAPTQHHEKLVYRVIAYVFNTTNYCLCYRGDASGGLVVYSDSDYTAKDTLDGLCYSGTVVMYNQMPIVWSSKKQSIIASDNCQSELYAMNFSLNKILSIFNLMKELEMIRLNGRSMVMYADNQSAKVIAETKLGPSSRHYDVALLYIEDFVVRKQLTIIHVKSCENLADLYTKLVANSLFYHFRDMLNVVNPHRRASRRTRT